MNIFILGMQGAGKTVFISQFFYYLRQKFGRSAIQGKNLSSTNYVAKIRDTLAGTVTGTPAWPESTKQGNPERLDFSINFRNLTGDLTLVDAAGQDIEELFCIDKPAAALTEAQQQIVDLIYNADVLIFLFDLGTMSSRGSYREKERDWWIFDFFRKICIEMRKPGLVVLAKADEFSGLPRDHYAYSDYIKDFIARTICDNESESRQLFSSDNKLFQYCAVSSVATQTFFQKGQPVRKPLESSSGTGWNCVCSFIVKVQEKEAEKAKKVKEAEKAKKVKEAEKAKKVKEAEDTGEGIGMWIGGVIGVWIGMWIGVWIGGKIGAFIVGLIVGLIVALIVGLIVVLIGGKIGGKIGAFIGRANAGD